MRHMVIIAFVLLMSATANAKDAHVRVAKNERPITQAEGTASHSNAAGEARVTATDINAPGNGWGKKAPKDSAPRVCDYGSAMSDEDIAFCRSR